MGGSPNACLSVVYVAVLSQAACITPALRARGSSTNSSTVASLNQITSTVVKIKASHDSSVGFGKCWQWSG